MGVYGATSVYEYPSSLLRVTSRDLEKKREEAEKLLEEGDFIQACEKFYKVAEETVKTLAEFYAPNTMKTVEERIRNGKTPWNIYLLNQAAEEISESLDNISAMIFRDGWRDALDLHRDCFHDFLLPPAMIRDASRNVLAMLQVSKELLRQVESNLLSSQTVNALSNPPDSPFFSD